MARGWFGQRIPDRLRTWPTAEELARMARHPTAFAPTAAEVLTPGSEPSLTLPALTDFGARDVALREGAVVGLSLTGRAFVAHSDALFTVAPMLIEVRFVAVRHLLGELVRCPNLARLRVLNFRDNRLDDGHARLLIACQHVHPLAELILSGHALTAVGEALVGNHFGNRAILR